MEEHVNPPRQGLYDPQNEHDSCGVGFVVDLKGRKSNKIVRDGVQILLNLEHRGACGAEKNTGDGAGILIQIPHNFLAAACAEAKGHITLPAVGHYGVGMVFLPSDPGSRAACEHLFEKVVRDEGQRVLGWREVPVDSRMLGPTARRSQPVIKQLFIARHPSIVDDDAFERKLYVIRRRARHAVRRLEIPEKASFYIASLSSRTIVYKGMLNCDQLTAFYLDLQDERVESALALVHSRFSTNTFPNWSRAHPYRMIAHNGEINTLRGNVNWMHARESMFASKLFGDDLQKCIPVVDTEGSDSGMFDNVLELLFLAGRSLPHAMMMMIPEPWSNHESMPRARKDFYEFHGCLMEPWDGPASVAFTDGVRIGATLDRNGLRPSRYYVTKDDLVVMASEVGVLDIPPERILEKGRLQPGRMFLVDTSQGRIIGDDEIKDEMAAAAPYGQWLKENLISIADLPKPPSVIEPDHDTVLRRQEAFGYTSEDLKVLVTPMAVDGVEANGSMGTDTPLAVLSNKPQLLYSYFKQLFAQVTNPPVDAIREEIIMAVDTAIGPEGNLLEPTPASARQIGLPTPVLRNEELEKLRNLDGGASSHGFKSITLPALYDVAAGGEGLQGRHRGAARRGQQGDRRREQHHHPLRPRARPAAGAHPGAADRRVGAASPAARRVTHAGRPGPRDRRAARGAPLRAAARLRRQRHQPLPGLRVAARHDQAGSPAGRAREGRAEVRQGRRQGDREGLLEDGDLDHPELPRGAGVRGHRPQPAVHRRVLHLDRLARRGDRHRGGRRRGARAPPARLPRAPAARGQPGCRGASTSTAATASTTSSTRRASTSCSTPVAPATSRSSRSTPSSSTIRRGTSARCAVSWTSSRRASRCRSTRSSRWRRF